MFKINRKIEYALMALKHMSAKSPGQLTSAKEICTQYNTPFDPTSRVLQIMTNKGILIAEQGARGGYQIVKDLNNVSILDLSQMIVGPIQIANCFHDQTSTCDISCSCNIIAPMLNLNEQLKELFSTTSVAQLLESTHSRGKTIKNNTTHRETAPTS